MVAAHLDKSTQIAKQLSIVSSNARAIAHRAGERAAGFNPLTDFIDHLAKVTITSSRNINQVATVLSKTASNMFRADQALVKFVQAQEKADKNSYIYSIEPQLNVTQRKKQALVTRYNQLITGLKVSLVELKGELRTAKVLVTLSRVEASQSDSQYQVALNSVADNVEQATSAIQLLISDSLKVVAQLEEKSDESTRDFFK